MRLELEFNDDINELLESFKHAPKQTKLATGRALRKTGRWIERQVLRELAAKVQVTQKKLKEFGRVSVSFYKKTGNKDSVLVVWIGTFDIPAHKLGKPVQTGKGVRGCLKTI